MHFDKCGGFMKSKPETNDALLPSTPLGDTDPLTHFQNECERLRLRVRELETEREADRRRLAELESERDHYRAEAYAWARKEFARKGLPDEEELKRRIQQEDGVPLEAFLGEIERVAKGT
jgi:hypothetical protein